MFSGVVCGRVNPFHANDAYMRREILAFFEKKKKKFAFTWIQTRIHRLIDKCFRILWRAKGKVVLTTPINSKAYLAVCVASSLLLNPHCELVWFEQCRSRVTHARARLYAPLVVGLQIEFKGVVVC